MKKFEVRYAVPISPELFESGLYPPGTFKNSEIEVDRETEEIARAYLLERLRKREPLVYGRDWYYTPLGPERVIHIEADSFSISRERIAHFYMKGENGKLDDYPSSAVANVIHVLPAREEKPKGSGGIGKVPWTPWPEAEFRSDTGGRNKRLIIRYTAPDGKVEKYGVMLDLDTLKPEFTVDLREQTGGVAD